MKREIAGRCFVLLLLLGSISWSQAALIPRLGGAVVYDTDLNITWMADANYAKTTGFRPLDGGIMYDDAETFIDAVNAGTYQNYGATNWRLPMTLVPDPACRDIFDTSLPSPIGPALGAICSGSEMGHLFYMELGGSYENSILSSLDPDVALFSNIVTESLAHNVGIYWAEPEQAHASAGNPALHYAYSFGVGFQTAGFDDNPYTAWLVRDGDLPVPATLALMGIGLAGLGFTRRACVKR